MVLVPDAQGLRVAYRRDVASSVLLLERYVNGIGSEHSSNEEEVMLGNVGVELARVAKNVDGPKRALVAVSRGPRAGELTGVGSG